MGDEPAKAENPRIKLVCVGKTYIEESKIGIVFKEIGADILLGRERIYAEKNVRQARVGAMYEVETDPNNPRSIFSATLRWLGLWENKEEAATWQLLAEAFATRDLAAKQQKKENARKLPLELLDPIRREYFRTNHAGKLAIEVRVLAYLRRTKVDDQDS
jgi:hypothetical protein